MKYSNSRKSQSGFTLIEIIVVVGIVGILAAIAYPSYTDYVKKGKRSDAKVELLRIAQLQESYFVQNLSYANSLANGAGGLRLGAATILTEQFNYNVSISATGPAGCGGTVASPCSSYTLEAVPTGSQVSDSFCEKFTLTNTGVKDVSVAGNARDCWK